MSDSSTSEKVSATLAECFHQLDGCFDQFRGMLEFRPEYEGAWTISEHLEHVWLANRFLLLTIEKGCRKACRRALLSPIPGEESDLARLAPVAIPGRFEWPVPPHMLPRGGCDPEQLRVQLRSQGEFCRKLLAGMPRGEGRLCRFWMSVNGLGKLDMYQWLYFLAQHVRYHLALIEERRRC